MGRHHVDYYTVALEKEGVKERNVARRRTTARMQERVASLTYAKDALYNHTYRDEAKC